MPSSPEWHKEYRRKNRDKMTRNHREYMTRRREWALEGRSCHTCGIGEQAVLCFHHVNPADKSFSIMGKLSMSKADLLEEMKKCVVLCANCHRRVHYLMQEFGL